MKVIRTVAELRAALREPRRAGQSIGLVPTMGALHGGHRSLIERARMQCDVVVMSLFVNPEQFNDSRDIDVYPRDEPRDRALAAEAGVNFLFAPAVPEVYPPGFSTAVTVTGVTDELEGAHRGRGHFVGVATVVTKLLNMVAPDVAYFGRKDAQQAVMIRRLVADLDLPVQIELCPTVRAPDGLALSSRNALLSPGERHRATALYGALTTVRDAVLDGERDPAAARADALAELEAVDVELEYLELVSPETMRPVASVDHDVLAVIAARLGATRLIDNTLIPVRLTAHAPASPPEREVMR